MIREIQLRRVLDRVEGAEGDGVAVAAPEGDDVPEDRRRQGHPPPGFPRAGPRVGTRAEERLELGRRRGSTAVAQLAKNEQARARGVRVAFPAARETDVAEQTNGFIEAPGRSR